MTTPPWPPAAKVKLGCMTFMDFTLGSVLSCNSRNFKTDKQSCGSIFFSTDTSNSCDEELKHFYLSSIYLILRNYFHQTFFFCFSKSRAIVILLANIKITKIETVSSYISKSGSYYHTSNVKVLSLWNRKAQKEAGKQKVRTCTENCMVPLPR